MITDDKIRDEKLQYNINKEVAKISALSSINQDKKSVEGVFPKRMRTNEIKNEISEITL